MNKSQKRFVKCFAGKLSLLSISYIKINRVFINVFY